MGFVACTVIFFLGFWFGWEFHAKRVANRLAAAMFTLHKHGVTSEQFRVAREELEKNDWRTEWDSQK